MLFNTAAALVGLAAVGHAILLPPHISNADGDIIEALPYEAAAVTGTQVLELKCTACPFAAKDGDGKTVWLNDVENVLVLNFSVATDGHDALYLNGQEAYPNSGLPFTARQVPRGQIEYADGTATGDDVRLGYAMRVQPLAHAGEDQLTLITVHLQIAQIGDVYVEDLEAVEVQLIKTPSGELLIGSLEARPTSYPSPGASGGHKECSSMVCRWRAMVAHQISQLKGFKGSRGCSGKPGRLGRPDRPGHGRHPHAHNGPDGRPGHDRRPHRPHRHHRQHSIVGTMSHVLHGVVLYILCPMVAGIAAGLVTSALGLLVGKLLVFVWVTFYRGARRGTYSPLDQDNGAIEDEEEAKSIERQGPPPVYEDIVVLDEKSAA